MDIRQIARQYQTDGYDVVRGVFSAAELAAIDQHLTDFIRDVVPALKPGDVYFEDAPAQPIKSIFRLHLHDPFFQKLLIDERLLGLMREIYAGAEVLAFGTAYFGKAAHSGSVTPPHQDNAFQNLQPPEELICTIGLDASTPANGALTVQRGSHQLGVLPHRPSGVLGFSQMLIAPLDPARYPPIQLCLQPGDIGLHHTNTVHYSGANTTDRSRRQLGLQYRSSRAQRDEAGWARYQAEVKRLHEQHAVAVAK